MSYDNYRELAERNLYAIRATELGELQAEVGEGRTWATLAFAAAIPEMAEAQAEQ